MPPTSSHDELVAVLHEVTIRIARVADGAPALTEVTAPVRPQTVAGVTWDVAELLHRTAWLVRHRPEPEAATYRPPLIVDHATAVGRLREWSSDCLTALGEADPAEPIAPLRGAGSVGAVTRLLCADLLPMATALEYAAGARPTSADTPVVAEVLQIRAEGRLPYQGDKPVVWSGHLTRVATTDTAQEWWWETGLAGGKYGHWALRPARPGKAAVEVVAPAEPLLRWLAWRTEEHPDVRLTGSGNDLTRFRTTLGHPGLPDVRLPLLLQMFGPRTAPYKHGRPLERSALDRPD